MTATTAMRPWAALGAVLFTAALVSCGGGGGGAPAQPLAEGALRPAQPGELAAYFRERIAQRSEQGYTGTMSREFTDMPVGMPGVVFATASAGTAPMQEAGVDEDDLIKSDGERIYALHSEWGSNSRLRTARIQPDGGLSNVAMTNLGDSFTPQGLYLASDARRLAVISERWYWGDVVTLAAAAILPMQPSKLAIDLFDTSGDAPTAAAHVEIDGRIVATRMIGNVLYVASSWTPDLSIYPVPANTPRAQVQERLAGMTSAQLLPTIRIGGGAAQALVDESQCLLQPANASLNLQLTTITAIDLSSPTLARSSRCMVGDASTLYMSPTSVYFATSRYVWIANVNAQAVIPPQATTDIHKFALQGLEIDYRGSGEVAGHLGWDVEKMPYRMSEHNGDLRVVGFTGSTGWGIAVPLAGAANAPAATPSPATLTILREHATERRLVKVASLPNAQRPGAIGKENEQVYAVHFAGDRGYVVTFRRTDPLYVLDLSNPSDPRTAGELTVPGFSDYLYPVGDGRLLGVGRAADAQGIVQGLQLSLFDVEDAAHPSVVASLAFGGRFSGSALDASRHGISLLASGNGVRVALPVLLANDNGSAHQQGLARFDVNLMAGTITQRPLVAAASPAGYIGFERSLLTDNASYYLTGGQLLYTPEP